MPLLRHSGSPASDHRAASALPFRARLVRLLSCKVRVVALTDEAARPRRDLTAMLAGDGAAAAFLSRPDASRPLRENELPADAAVAEGTVRVLASPRQRAIDAQTGGAGRASQRGRRPGAHEQGH